MSSIVTATKQAVYQAFGMRLASRIPLPETRRFDSDGPEGDDADVVIEEEDLTGLQEQLGLDRDNFVLQDGRFAFRIPETAIYCIENGFKITVSPMPGADPDKVRLYLLGTCMGSLLMMRKMLPLHGSAVVIEGKAYAVVGDSGAGKSTLAAALVRQGYPLLTDDVIAVSLDHPDGIPRVMPSYPQQKLWRESLDLFGLETNRYRHVYRELTKFAVPVAAEFHPDPVQLAGVFELVKSERGAFELNRLPNLERLRVLLLHTYRNILIHRLGLAEWHFRASAQIARHAWTYRMVRPQEGCSAHSLASQIVQLAIKGEETT